MDIPVDKLQAFYKVEPIQKVNHVTKTKSERQNSGQESKNNLEFQKTLMQYYDMKTQEFQGTTVQKSASYDSRAAEAMYEAASTVNFFG